MHDMPHMLDMADCQVIEFGSSCTTTSVINTVINPTATPTTRQPSKPKPIAQPGAVQKSLLRGFDLEAWPAQILTVLRRWRIQRAKALASGTDRLRSVNQKLTRINSKFFVWL
jgi:hypothetical protein